MLISARLHDRWGDQTYVTSPIWGSPPPCKQVLNNRLENLSMRELNGKMYFSCCKQVVRILVFQNRVEGKAAVLPTAKH